MKLGIIPYQKGDFEVDEDKPRPNFPQFTVTYENFHRPQDIPLNKRHFVYGPCAPIPDFEEVGYCNTEYPFDKPGFNIMDRSDGISFKVGHNDTIGVAHLMGWRTARCDVCIKEGLSYWEVEVIKGGTSTAARLDASSADKKEVIDNTPHLRFGISRRESSLDAPVGFDSYGYGIRDQSLESIHEGKLKKFLQKSVTLKHGDRLGFLLKLPDSAFQIEQAKEYTRRRLDALQQLNNVGSAGEHIHNHVFDSYRERSPSPLRKKPKHQRNTHIEFQRELLNDIDYSDVIRDQIAIRYKNQLFFEGTDYVKTTKSEYYSSDERERQDFYKLDGSYLRVFLNGEYLGEPFSNLSPFLPPFSELQYNEKFYYGYWKHGEHLDTSEIESSEGSDSLKQRHRSVKGSKGLLLKNKYVNNNRLGYYPTVSCFNGGEAMILTKSSEMKYLDTAVRTLTAEEKSGKLKLLDVLLKEQISDDIVWDIIDEVVEECKKARGK